MNIILILLGFSVVCCVAGFYAGSYYELRRHDGGEND